MTASLDSSLTLRTWQTTRDQVIGCFESFVLVAWSKEDGRQLWALGVPGCEDFTVEGESHISIVARDKARAYRFPIAGIPRGNFTLSGTINDWCGRPLAGATVSGGLRSTLSDARGRYRLEAGVVGEVCVAVRHPGDGSVGFRDSAEVCFRPGRIEREYEFLLVPWDPFDHTPRTFPVVLPEDEGVTQQVAQMLRKSPDSPECQVSSDTRE